MEMIYPLKFNCFFIEGIGVPLFMWPVPPIWCPVPGVPFSILTLKFWCPLICYMLCLQLET